MSPILSKHRSHFLRWLHFVAKHKAQLIVAFVLLVIGMATEVVFPKAVGFIIDRMLVEKAISSGKASLPFFGEMEIKRAFIAIFLFLLAVLLLRAVTGYYRNILLCTVGEKVHLDVRGALFRHLQRLPLTYFDSNYTGRIMAHITTDCDALWHLVYDGTNQIIVPAITIAVVLVLLIKIHIGLTLCSIAILPVFAYLYSRTHRKAGETSRVQRESLAIIYSKLQERISGIRLIRAFGREKVENESFSREMNDLYRHNISLVGSYTGLGTKVGFLTGAATVAILCFGGIAVTAKGISVGGLVSFYLYIGMLFGPLTQITNAAARIFTDASVAMERIFRLLDTPVAQELQGANTPCPKLRGSVAVEGLRFAYHPDEAPVLEDICFTAREGEIVALAGPSGGGKTTLVNLLCRFYHAQQGTIKIDGYDIRQFDIESFRRQISYVSQDSFLFSGSIADNIRFAQPDASQQEIENAAKCANAHDFIVCLPHGYQTEAGERGVKLSGGQKQRINIARALLREPAILILDEPTSALDAENESIILEALETIFKNRTCFIIAHRLSTVMRADKILVMEKGRIVQEGSHAALADKPGLYRELCKKQFIGFAGSEQP